MELILNFEGFNIPDFFVSILRIILLIIVQNIRLLKIVKIDSTNFGFISANNMAVFRYII